jgi:signal transduction histidine kinase
MFAVVASVVLSTLFSQSLLRYDVDALSIAGNAAPSVAALADARAELRRLARSAEDGDTAAYTAARARLNAALTEYRSTPSYPGEAQIYAPVAGMLGRLDAAAARSAATHSDGESRRRIVDTMDEIDRTLHSLSEVNRTQMQISARAIVAKERRFTRYAVALDGVAIVIAMIATLLVAQAIRRYAQHLERRSRELEHLAVQVGHEIANPLTPLQLAVGLGRDRLSDPMAQRCFDRAERSLERIRESIDRLIAFARAGIPPAGAPPATLLTSAIQSAVAVPDIPVAGDAAATVSCDPVVLGQIVHDLVGAAVAAPSKLLRVEIRQSMSRVRLTLICTRRNGKHEPNPFEPVLFDLPSGHPGIDLRLATVRRLVEARQGTVGFRDRKGARILWVEMRRA